MDRKYDEDKSMIAIVLGLIGGVADNIRSVMNRQIAMKKKMLAKKIIAGILLLVGLVLFLNGLAIMIDTFANNFWVGHTLVGIVVVAIGYVLLHSSENNHY